MISSRLPILTLMIFFLAGQISLAEQSPSFEKYSYEKIPFILAKIRRDQKFKDADFHSFKMNFHSKIPEQRNSALYLFPSVLFYRLENRKELENELLEILNDRNSDFRFPACQAALLIHPSPEFCKSLKFEISKDVSDFIIAIIQSQNLHNNSRISDFLTICDSSPLTQGFKNWESLPCRDILGLETTTILGIGTVLYKHKYYDLALRVFEMIVEKKGAFSAHDVDEAQKYLFHYSKYNKGEWFEGFKENK